MDPPPDDPYLAFETASRGSACGRASFILGVAVALAAGVTVLMASAIGHTQGGGVGIAEWVMWTARLSVIAPLLLALLAGWLGFVGVFRRRRSGQSVALPVAGVVASGVALTAWVLAAIHLLFTTEKL